MNSTIWKVAAGVCLLSASNKIPVIVTQECYLIGGTQFKVTLNDVIMVNKLDAELGSQMRLEKVKINLTLVP